MADIGHRWAGKIYGTNTGNVFLSLEANGEAVSGVLRLNDDAFGIAVYEVTGTFDGSKLALAGSPKHADPNVQLGEIKAGGKLNPEGHIRGDWESSLGTGGTFHLFPHDPPKDDPAAPPALAERLHTANRTLGAVRLYGGDVAELISQVKEDFGQGQVIVTYRAGGANEVSLFAAAFLGGAAKVERLRYLRIGIAEPEPRGALQRLVNIELNATGDNIIRVQGGQEAWVLGTAERLAAYMKNHERWLVTGVRKFGLNFNGLLALFVLAALPDLLFWRRVAFIGIVAVIVLVVAQLHARYIPNAAIYLSARRPGSIERLWPQVASAGIAILTGFAASVAYGLLKGELILPDGLLRLLPH